MSPNIVSKSSEETKEQWDTSTNDEFLDYYSEASLTAETLGRFERLVELVVKALQREGRSGPFKVADIGAGAGTLSRIFAHAGHKVASIEISKDLSEIARQRAQDESLDITFINCSATNIALSPRSVDICVLPELLEHVKDWEGCLDEAGRILRPGGVLYLSTTNTLCPRQEEFNLPLYSWYPGFLKRYYENLAFTTRPEIANYAKYPAVNWFTFYSLQTALRKRGFDRFLDRSDMIELRVTGSSKAHVAKLIQTIPFMRLALQFLTPNSLILAFKAGESSQ